jgi:hypothetical protein
MDISTFNARTHPGHPRMVLSSRKLNNSSLSDETFDVWTNNVSKTDLSVQVEHNVREQHKVNAGI